MIPIILPHSQQVNEKKSSKGKEKAAPQQQQEIIVQDESVSPMADEEDDIYEVYPTGRTSADVRNVVGGRFPGVRLEESVDIRTGIVRTSYRHRTGIC